MLAHPRWFPYSTSSLQGGVAQLGERLTGSQEVRGSIPLVSTMKSQARVYALAFFIAINHQMRVITITVASQSAHEITLGRPSSGFCRELCINTRNTARIMYICSLCGVIRQIICKIAAFPAVPRATRSITGAFRRRARCPVYPILPDLRECRKYTYLALITGGDYAIWALITVTRPNGAKTSEAR